MISKDIHATNCSKWLAIDLQKSKYYNDNMYYARSLSTILRSNEHWKVYIV